MLNANLTSTRKGNKKGNTDISFLEAPSGAASIFCEQYVVSGAPIGAHILNALTADEKNGNPYCVQYITIRLYVDVLNLSAAFYLKFPRPSSHKIQNKF